MNRRMSIIRLNTPLSSLDGHPALGAHDEDPRIRQLLQHGVPERVRRLRHPGQGQS